MLLVFVFLTLITNAEKLARRIYDGEEAKRFTYTFMAAIFLNNKFTCGGALIKSNIVVTAGHCSQASPHRYQVHLGRHNLSQAIENEKGQLLNVVKIEIHEKFKGLPLVKNDIALLFLKDNATTKYKPVDWGGVFDHHVLYHLLGWGKTNVEKLRNILSKATVISAHTSKCYFKYLGRINPNNEFCMHSIASKSTGACFRDSGSPVVFKENSKFVLIGLVSRGKKCGLDFPTIFTKYDSHLSWVTQSISSFHHTENVK